MKSLMICTAPNITLVIKSPIMRCAEHVECMGARGGAYRVLVRKSEGRRLLGRPWYKGEGNIKLGLQEVGRGAWTGLIWLRIRTDGELL
jgi:hypothetical protein